MKCPKCGYISFDYNQVCPKCNRNISFEQEKINLPSFRPETPSLLGFLTGEANESNVNIRVPSGSHRMDKDSSQEINLNDSVILDQDQLGIDSHDLDVSFEPEESEEDLFDQDLAAEPAKKLSDADLRLEGKTGEEDVITSEPEEEISLDLGDLSLEDSEDLLDKAAVREEQSSIPVDVTGAGLSLGALDSLQAEIDTGLDDLGSEIELDLDDLKVGDLGNLEVGADMELSDKEMESTLVESEAETLQPEIELSDEEEGKLPDISELILEGADAGSTDKTMFLDDFSFDDSGPSGKEVALELGDIPLDDLAAGEEALDLDDINLEEAISGDKELPTILDNLGINDSAELEKSFDIGDLKLDEDFEENEGPSGSKEFMSDSGDLELDLDGVSSDVEKYQKKSDSGDDFVLDLEDMDIDLDLNEPKKKS
jgi:hypothetical protein